MQNNTPIYSQLEKLIKDKILSGEYKFGEAIPSERKLAETYGINRMTVRSAINNLENQGYIVKVHGKGNFVSSPKFKQNFVEGWGFTSLLRERGIEHKDKLIFSGVEEANYQLSKIFGVERRTPLFRIVRLRLGDDEPLRLEDTYVPYDLFPGIESIDYSVTSLYDVFQANGITLKEFRQVLSSYLIHDFRARLLDLEDDYPVYRVTCQTMDQRDRVVEYTVSLINPQKTIITTSLK